MADTPKEQRKLRKQDWACAAEYISDELSTRKRKRRDKEKIWDEVDRQVAQVPRPTNIDHRTGRVISGKEWQTFKELPWQGQALEVLSADAHRILFPDTRNWFSAHASVNDLDLAAIDTDAMVGGTPDLLGERGISVEDIESIVEGAHTHYQDIYKFRHAWDRMTISALKYGTMVGRARMAKLSDFSHETRGVMSSSQMIPALVPMDVRQVYLDDSPSTLQHSDEILPPSPIFTYKQRVSDLMLAASKGGSNAGWITANLKNLEANEDGFVEVAEYEGDIVIPRKTQDSIYLPNVIITAVMGKENGKGVSNIVRYRENPFKFSSYVIDVYHPDDFSTNYGTSPLLKGMPVQQAATDFFNRLCHSGILNTEPPIGYDDSDPALAAMGGPQISPSAMWPSLGEIKTHQIGEPEKLLQVYLSLVQQYQEVSGVSAPRLGAQTKSHQTAFAVDTEVQRGVIRTVDFTRHMMGGAMRTWLSLEYEMIRKIIGQKKKPTPMYIPKLRGFLNVSKDVLPEAVSYDVHGVGGPAEEQQRNQRRTQALMTALQIEPVAQQVGGKPIDIDRVRVDLLREGGIDNASEYFIQKQVAPGPDGLPPAAQGGPQVSGANGAAPDPNAAVGVAAGIRPPIE